MRTRIKFCGLVREQDIELAVALGVDAIGFVFYPKSPRFVTFDQAAQLRRRLPSFVAAVGLFVNAPADQVQQACGSVGLDVVQFHGDETPQLCGQAARDVRHYWRAVRMRGPGDLLESARQYPQAEALLLDAFSQAYGGTGKQFDWSWIPPQHGCRLILSGGLDAGSVGEAIEAVKPFAVDVSSGIQAAADPRVKDAHLMARFVEAVSRADARRNDVTES